MNKFSLNQIVKGTVGLFVIIGFRMIDGKEYAQVKRYCAETGKAQRGEFALPVESLKEVL